MRSSPRCPIAMLCLALACAPASAQAPDLSRYDCTRTDDGKTVPGDKLAADGFQIASQARFGAVNLMLANPKTSARANCFKRPDAPK